MLWMPLMNIIKKKMDSLYSIRLVCNLFNLSDWWKLLGTIHDIRHCPNFLKPLPPLEHPRALRFLDFRLSIFSKPSPPPLLGRPLCMVPYMNYIYIWYYLILSITACIRTHTHIYIYSGSQNVRRQWFLANKKFNLRAIFMIFGMYI